MKKKIKLSVSIGAPKLIDVELYDDPSLLNYKEKAAEYLDFLYRHVQWRTVCFIAKGLREDPRFKDCQKDT